MVCEIRFPGELSIECQRDKFYAKVRDQYPNLLIPKALPGSASSLEPYRFEDDANNSGIMLAINKFSFYQRTYEGHKMFIKKFLKLAKILGDTFKLNKLNRLGWRYINIIPFAREDGTIPLNRFISIGIKTPEGVSEDFENLSIVFISKISEGSITTKVEPVIREDSQEEGIALDFDFFMTKELNLSNLKEKVNNAHMQTRLLFENIITDNYREYLRGNTI